jgi:ribonuclease P protein component
MGSFSFPKKERLLNRADFVNLNRLGERHHTRHFTLTIKKNGLGITRLGITATKKVGNAVKRNRIKRLIREFFRLNKSKFPQGYDIVIAAKKNASYLDKRKAKEELAEVIFDKKFCV